MQDVVATVCIWLSNLILGCSTKKKDTYTKRAFYLDDVSLNVQVEVIPLKTNDSRLLLLLYCTPRVIIL